MRQRKLNRITGEYFDRSVISACLLFLKLRGSGTASTSSTSVRWRRRRVESGEACFSENLALLPGANQCVVERFSVRREIRRARQRKFRAQGIHRKNVFVRIGRNIRRRAWPVVLLSEAEVVFDLQTVGAAGYAGVLRKLSHIAADVVHAPMGKRGGDIVKDHREELSPLGAPVQKSSGDSSYPAAPLAEQVFTPLTWLFRIVEIGRVLSLEKVLLCNWNDSWAGALAANTPSASATPATRLIRLP